MTADIHSQIAQAQRRPTVTQVLERMGPDLARSIPKGLDPDRVSRLALTVIRTSELAKAKGISKSSLSDSTPESFAGALLTAVALGLEPGTAECYLVPYKDGRSKTVECQLIIGYQGMIKLYRQHPMASHIGAQVVYENDTFDYQYGSDKFLRHRPASGDRGKIIYYYADAQLTNGAYEFEVLTPEDVKALRRGKVGASGDIPDPMHWMERKTVLRQLLKIMPRTTRVDAALEADEQSGRELARQQVPQSLMSRAEIETVPSASERIDLATGEITTSSDPVEARPTREQLQRETAAIQQARDEYLDEKYPQSSSGAAGEAGTDPGDDPATGPASQSVEDQQAEVRRLSEERRQLRRSQPDPAADPGSQTGGPSEGNFPGPQPGSAQPTEVIGREPGSKITVPQQAEINRHFARLEVTDPQEKLWWVHRFAGLPEGTVEQPKELRQPEADRIIAALERLKDRDELDQLLNGQSELIP